MASRLNTEPAATPLSELTAEPIEDRRVLYLYGVTESRPRNIPQRAGVDLMAKVEPVNCDGVICWISRVPALDFEDNLIRNMENLDWLAEASVAHQRVISAIASKTEILPARFATIFRSEDSLHRHIGERTRDLKTDFKRIKGAEEWGLKVFAIQPPNSSIPGASSGKDYLKAKAALLPKPRTQSRSVERRDLAQFYSALKRVAIRVAASGNVSGGQRGLLFQTALLVKRSNRKKLDAVLERFARDWGNSRRIECTGPWPPYSFVSRPDDGVRAK